LRPPGHRFETGTQLHENIAGFVAAVEYLADLGTGNDLSARLDSAFSAIQSRETELAGNLLRGIGDLSYVRVAGVQDADAHKRVGTFGLLVEKQPASLARALGEKGIYTWNGNFYAQNVVEHLGLDLEEGLLRIGLMHYNTDREIQRCVEQLGLLV
jgi:selenocysteine lyase/cysteine desulfurase